MGFVSRERYLDPQFAAREHDRLWPRVWQMACRLEEIPDVGDFVEYAIGDQSIIVVKAGRGETEVRAFHNACRHRATQLITGSGSLADETIVCPFHGWRWRLDGSNAGALGRHTFSADLVTPDDLCLRQCQVDTWAACVWINMDDNAPPLREVLAPMPDLLDPLGIDRMRVRWWKHTILGANWKLAQEAFMEGFHVPRTHPQLDDGSPPESLTYSVYERGHSSFQNARGPSPVREPAAIIEASRRLWTGLDAMTLERDVAVFESLQGAPIPEGASFGSLFMTALYERAALDGITLPTDRDALARWGGVFFVFPNFFVLPQYGNALIYRARPNGSDTESCVFELWSVTMPTRKDPPARRPTRLGPFAPDDATHWPLIPLQDFSNIERQQRGLHSRSITGVRLSGVYEEGIVNMHAELDRYLAKP